MIIRDNLYTEGLSERKLNKIIKQIKRKKSFIDIFVITFPIVHTGLLEIYPYFELSQKVYNGVRNNIEVVGITNTREEAINQVMIIIDELYKETGDFDIKSFLMKTG